MNRLFSKKNTRSPRLATSLSRIPVPLLPLPPLAIPSIDYHPPPTTTSTRRPIPSEKLEDALVLYEKYRAAITVEALADRDATSPASHHPYLMVPYPSARSATSRTSSGRPRVNSVSTEYDAMTDVSSVLSFQDNEKPSKANSVSYTGRAVKQSRRRPFIESGRRKTHLIRLLGTCPECQAKKTSCPLDHHDIDALKRILDERRKAATANDFESQEAHQAGSSSSRTSQKTARSLSGRHLDVPGSSQNDFLGIGTGTLLLQSAGPDTPRQEFQSPLVDLLEGIQLSPGNAITNLPFRPQPDYNLGTEGYGNYGNGALFLLGLKHNDQDNYFYCQHLSGCQRPFQDAAELQDHFESEHFPFTRIDPATKHVCLDCFEVNEANYMRCQWCFVHGNIQTQVQGHFIRAPHISYYPGSGPAPLQYDPSSTTYYPSAYASSIENAETGSPDDFGSGLNPGPFVDNGPDSNPYGGPSDHGYGYDGYDGSPEMGNNGFGFQQNFYRGARQMALKHSTPARVLYATAKRHSQRVKHLLLLILLLVVLIISITHDEIISKARATFPRAGPEIREHLPTIGFIVLFVSIGAFFLMKLRIRDDTPIHSRPVPCAMRALGPYATRFKVSGHTAYVQRSEHL